ncbi:hypothetical protein LJ737_16705 [Hymenobacter sp. 15J16-1T3B]|uniref:hypothetical protein n=1 Tax=Hymenobacter sp. 15J16-1T3B TaxID=2886941 RepID=UPI001D10B574|nr:hypothetical protein [Hymenobacter sp. 15J16-1T3B]MCC3158885.1 hypothetical protein [Hymenobacter sp. 15J16-1T3B]
MKNAASGAGYPNDAAKLGPPGRINEIHHTAGLGVIPSKRRLVLAVIAANKARQKQEGEANLSSKQKQHNTYQPQTAPPKTGVTGFGRCCLGRFCC